MIRKVVNAVLFQAAWLALVLSAAKGYPWLGLAAMVPLLATHLGLVENRRGEVKLLLAAASLGFLFDTALVYTGVFTPLPYLLPWPFSPPWMICLWLGFASTLNVSLSWLRGRYLLAALFGGIGGPLAYYSGARLGATEGLPSSAALLVLAVGWALMTPLLVRLATDFETTTARHKELQNQPVS
jgi:hypothetical protein